MPVNWISSRQAQHAILKAFALLTRRAIGLFELTGDGEIREVLPLEGFESYCRKIQEFSGGERLCRADHIKRAKQAMESGTGELTLCHAGVFNQTLPIAIDGKVRAILMYGQMWVEGDDRCGEARKRHESVITHLDVAEQDELELRVYYDEIRKFSPDALEALNQQLSLLQHLFYGMLSEEQERGRQTEGLIHELQTRLQPVLARAENLYYDLHRIGAECRPVREHLPAADRLLRSVLAMRTLVRSLGDFMPEYRFETGTLEGIVNEAIAIYGAEAEQRRVDILKRLEKPSRVEMSRVHLQEAINNLLHNAIKYSFRGAHDRYRFVEIEGEVDGPDYVLTLSNYGVGILPGELELIFQPGYKGELTRGEYRSGSGMGLAIAKEIIEKHQGTIEAQSAKTDGEAYVNRFTVRLPFKQQGGGDGYEDCLD